MCTPYGIRLEFSSKLSELMKQYSATDRVTALSTQVPATVCVPAAVLLRWHYLAFTNGPSQTSKRVFADGLNWTLSTGEGGTAGDD